MSATPPIRDDVADRVHHGIIALQDALTHLWAAVLAIEVVDTAPGGTVTRDAVLESLKSAYLRWQECQSDVETAFRDWTAVVGDQQQEVAAVHEWLRATCPDLTSLTPDVSFVSDPEVTQHIMAAVDREACERTRRLLGCVPLQDDETCNCLFECPAVQSCPLFRSSE